MSDPKMPQLQGNPIWFALPTPDPEGAKRFYTDLFGWEWAEVPMGEGSTYHMAIEGDANIAGMHLERPEDSMSESDKVWHNYICVDDAHEMAKRIVDHGGSVLSEPSPVDMPDGKTRVGISGTVATPEGAVFCLWQSVTGYGAEIFAVPGAVCWIEYHSHDVESAMRWYRDVFGVDFTAVTVPSSDPDVDDFILNMLTIDGKEMSCAFFQMSEEWSSKYPAMWATYFMVENAHDAAEKAVNLGAEIVMPPTTVPPGTFAALKDPQGVNFSIWQSA